MNRRKQASDAYKSNTDKEGNDNGFEPLPQWLKRHDADFTEKVEQEETTTKNSWSSSPEDRAGTPQNTGETGRHSSPEGGDIEADQGRSPFSGFLKTGSGSRKAAKLLLLLGKERAAEVLRHLSQREVEEVTKEIAKIKKIEKPEAEKLLQEFGTLTKKVTGIHGGYSVAREILRESLGDEEADKVLKRVRPTGEEKPFAFLAELDYQQIMMLLRKESPHVVTLVLSHLPPKKSSEVLESFPPDFQIQVVKRMANLGRVSPEALTTVEEKLKERYRTQGKVVTEEVDGQEVLAEILKHMPLSEGGRILETLRERYGDLAEHIRDKLYSIEIVNDIPDADLQKVLRSWEDRELAVILKGASSEVEQRIHENISTRRREFIAYEREHLGEMRRSEVDEPMKEFIDYLREKIESGEIVLRTDELV